jgi:hypothetical protein
MTDPKIFNEFTRKYERAKRAGISPSKEHEALYFAIIGGSTHTNGIPVSEHRVRIAWDTLADLETDHKRQPKLFDDTNALPLFSGTAPRADAPVPFRPQPAARQARRCPHYGREVPYEFTGCAECPISVECYERYEEAQPDYAVKQYAANVDR